jgi:phosphoribosylformimino-5-aminoimidazole carboxamide ribotide isomerase
MVMDNQHEELSHNFIIFPAIDLRSGEVVRLKEGDPNRQTRYASDPAAAACRWLEAGAGWLHVVNLDGAFEQPDAANRAALQAILRKSQQFGAQVQFGGGLRSLAMVEDILQLGVARAVLGTLVIQQPELLSEALQRWGAERIAVSLDARGGKVAVRGWQQATDLNATDLACQFSRAGLRWLVFTDIARDGLQTGLNLPATAELARASGLQVIASGGVASQADLDGARAAGLAGAIVGKALYEGALDAASLFQIKPKGA